MHVSFICFRWITDDDTHIRLFGRRLKCAASIRIVLSTVYNHCLMYAFKNGPPNGRLNKERASKTQKKNVWNGWVVGGCACVFVYDRFGEWMHAWHSRAVHHIWLMRRRNAYWRVSGVQAVNHDGRSLVPTAAI